MKQHHTYQLLLYILLTGIICFSTQAKNAFENPYVLVQNYTINDYHASCQNWDVYVSAEGTLYVANNSGLLEFDGNTWHLYQTKDQEALFQIGMRNDTLYSRGEKTNGFWLYNKEMIMEYTPISENLPDSIFHDFRQLQPFPVPDEIEKAGPQIYAGTNTYKFVSSSNGLFVTDSAGQVLHHLSMSNSLQDNMIHDICVQDIDQIWLALDNGITQVNINPPVSRLGTRSQIGKLEQVGSNEDYLYIKTNLGYFRKELGTQYSFTPISEKEALPHLDKQPSIITQPVENLFYEPEALGYFNKAQYIYPLPENMYWIVKGNEAALFQNEFNTTTQKCRILFDNYQMNLTTRSPHFFILNDSMYVVSAMQGTLLVDIRQIMKQNMQLTMPMFHSIRYSDSHGIHYLYPDTQEITLPHRFQEVNLFVSTTVFTPNHQFSYLLEGISTDWSEWQKDGKIAFSQLPEGTYTLHIRKYVTKGPFPEIVLQIKVLPAWYNTVWAYCIYVILIWIIIQLVLHYHLKKLKREELIQKQREEEQEQQRVEQMKNQMLETELQNKNNELTLQTSALVRRNKAIQTFLDELNQQKESLGDRYPNKLYNKLRALMEDALNDQEDWLLFDSYFNSAHQNFINRLQQKYPDLTPGDLRICCLLRMNLSTKEIASLLNISVRAVELRRYRLRKRLELNNDINLVEFLLKL